MLAYLCATKFSISATLLFHVKQHSASSGARGKVQLPPVTGPQTLPEGPSRAPQAVDPPKHGGGGFDRLSRRSHSVPGCRRGIVEMWTDFVPKWRFHVELFGEESG